LAAHFPDLEILELVGRGGMGVVYKAWDPTLYRIVAIKVISQDLETTGEIRERFNDEARRNAALTHPNLVTIFEMGEDDGQLFIVMELLEGEELKSIISKRKPTPIEDKVAIMVQLCEGLYFAHQKGVCHRDIKPGNVFVLQNGTVKIIDFGIAKVAGMSSNTRTGILMGSPRYMAPEQLTGISSPASDQYSLGALCYELLTLQPPFTGDNLGHLLDQVRREEPPAILDLDPSIPRELAAIVERAMRKDPETRYPDLNKMRNELVAFRRRLDENVQRVRERIRPQLAQLRELEAQLRAIDESAEATQLPELEDVTSTAALETLEQQVTSQVGATSTRIEQVRSIEPAMKAAGELIRQERFADAAAEYGRILTIVPRLAAAREGLETAEGHVRAEIERRRQATLELLERARAALAERKFEKSLSVLAESASIPAPPDTEAEIEALREVAEAGLEALKQAKLDAENERGHVTDIRLRVQAEHPSELAPALWKEAETTTTTGDAALERGDYEAALKAFDAAGHTYERFEEECQALRLRERAEAVQLRDQMGRLRSRARESGAPRHAEEIWDSAEAAGTEANASMGRNAYRDAAGRFKAACALYSRAIDAAAKVKLEEQRRIDEARAAMAEARQAAASAGADKNATTLWGQAGSMSSRAEEELAQGRQTLALDALAAARGEYLEAGKQAQVREAERVAHEAELAREAERAREAEAAKLAEKQAQEAQRIKEAEAQARAATPAGSVEKAGEAEDEATVLLDTTGGARASADKAAAPGGRAAKAGEAEDEATVLLDTTGGTRASADKAAAPGGRAAKAGEAEDEATVLLDTTGGARASADKTAAVADNADDVTDVTIRIAKPTPQPEATAPPTAKLSESGAQGAAGAPATGPAPDVTVRIDATKPRPDETTPRPAAQPDKTKPSSKAKPDKAAQPAARPDRTPPPVTKPQGVSIPEARSRSNAIVLIVGMLVLAAVAGLGFYWYGRGAPAVSPSVEPAASEPPVVTPTAGSPGSAPSAVAPARPAPVSPQPSAIIPEAPPPQPQAVVPEVAPAVPPAIVPNVVPSQPQATVPEVVPPQPQVIAPQAVPSQPRAIVPEAVVPAVPAVPAVPINPSAGRTKPQPRPQVQPKPQPRSLPPAVPPRPQVQPRPQVRPRPQVQPRPQYQPPPQYQPQPQDQPAPTPKALPPPPFG